MSKTIQKIRKLLERALERADIDDDVKTAIDVSKILLPLEEQLQKDEAAKSYDLHGVDDMPETACMLLKSFDERVVAGETLSEFERGQVFVLDMAARGELLLRGELVAADPPPVVAIPETPPVASAPVTQSSTTTPTPTPTRVEPVPSDPDHRTTTTLEYGSVEREEATRMLWRQFGIRPREY